MAGASTAALAAAVSDAGALGGFGGTDASPDELRQVIRAIRAQTSRPFIVNLYLDRADPYVSDAAHETALKTALAPAHAELTAGEVPDPVDLFGKFDSQVAVAIEERVPVLSSHFGPPDAAVMRALKAIGTCVIATATTVDEARMLESAGIAAIIAQGSEAGGHRGTFGSPAGHALIGTMALVPQIVDAVSVPVIAAGGIMDGRGILAALALGAAAAQLGTAFLLCDEAGTDAGMRRAVAAAGDTSTMVTRAFTGRAARGIRNRFIEEWGAREPAPFPLQHLLTVDIRAAARKAGHPELVNLWAGQGVARARAVPAGELVAALVAELAAARRGLDD